MGYAFAPPRGLLADTPREYRGFALRPPDRGATVRPPTPRRQAETTLPSAPFACHFAPSRQLCRRPGSRESPSTYGCEAGLAGRPGRAPGDPLARELRDLAARHRAR